LCCWLCCWFFLLNKRVQGKACITG
jgi:hypothetical protein